MGDAVAQMNQTLMNETKLTQVMDPSTYAYKDGDTNKNGFTCPWPNQKGFSSVINSILI